MLTSSANQRRNDRGQIIVIAAFGIVALVAFAALVLEAGNAYAQQRVAQNGSDGAANAGAVTLAQRLGGISRSDAEVYAAVSNVAGDNNIDRFTARYTDVTGRYLDNSGAVVVNAADAAVVGNGDGVATIPANAQGVAVDGTRSFPAFIGQAIGFTSFDASASATAVAGRLVGGQFLPIVIPVSIVDCETNGTLGSVPEDEWKLSQPGTPPSGIEYIVPLCKTGEGSFQVLDLDPDQRCDEEVATPPYVQWDVLPVDVPSDNGNNCARPIEEYVNENLHYKTVLLPICDNSVGFECGTEGGSRASYRITRVAAFFIDYMSDSNSPNNPECQTHTSGTGQLLQTIAGNGSSSCIVGWFVKYISAGPVGVGSIGNSDAIGIQLIR